MKHIPYYLLAIYLGISNHSFSQASKIVADKIIAQIGDKIILSSDLDTTACYGINLGERPECTLLERLLVEKCLAIEAAKDSVVTETELETELNEQLRHYVEQYGGEKQLQSATGKTLDGLKEQIRCAVTERLLSNNMREKIVRGVNISPAEVEDYFAGLPLDSVPWIDETFEASELVIYPKADKDKIEQLAEQLSEWRDLVKEGKQKFDVLAKLYSQDPGSNAQGGMYNVNKSGRQWDPIWFAEIWKLKEGQISPVVQSKFGLHIIQMISRAGDNAIIRHIMLVPKMTNAELNNAKELLDSVRDQILLRNITFNAAVNKYTGDEAGRKNAGQLIGYDGSIKVTRDDLDRDVAVVLENMRSGQISKPFEYKDDTQRDVVAIIFLRCRTPVHKASLDTDYDMIAEAALAKKRNTVFQQWLKLHMHDFYVHIDKDFDMCDNTTRWVSTTKN